MARLKGLDEFEPPAFVGRVERRRKTAWWMLIAAFAVGVGLGLMLFP